MYQLDCSVFLNDLHWPHSFFVTTTYKPSSSTTNALSALADGLDRLTLHNDSYGGGGSIVAIILNSTGVISTGAAQYVNKLQHECQVHSASYYRLIWCPPVELCHW